MGIRIEALAETAGCTLGARVFGVDVRALDETEWRAVHAAFLEYGLLLFADQALSAAEQADFASRFGTIEVLVEDMTTIPLSNKALAGGTLETDTFQMQLLRGNEGWHTDSSYMPLAAKASVLSAQVVPDAGGETEWADARAAYDALDPAPDLEVLHRPAQRLAAGPEGVQRHVDARVPKGGPAQPGAARDDRAHRALHAVRAQARVQVDGLAQQRELVPLEHAEPRRALQPDGERDDELAAQRAVGRERRRARRAVLGERGGRHRLGRHRHAAQRATQKAHLHPRARFAALPDSAHGRAHADSVHSLVWPLCTVSR